MCHRSRVCESVRISTRRDVRWTFFLPDTTAKAIMTAGLWWPTLFQDAKEYVKRCEDCQRTKVPIRKDNMPL